jgi:hypothetical protein
MGHPSPATTATPTTLADDDLPLLFRQTDKAAIRAQKRFFNLLRAELVLLLAGTLAGLFSFLPFKVGPLTISGVHIPALPVADLVAAVFILIALIMRLIRFFRHPDTLWYEARAVAESAKSLGWRYAVGGRPFDLTLDLGAADALLIQRLQDSLKDVRKIAGRITFSEAGQVTTVMRDLRQQDAATRHRVYQERRIEDQQHWYARKAIWNKHQEWLFHWILVALEIIGASLAILEAFKVIPSNFQALVVALVSAGIAWTQARRYQDLRASYNVAAKEAQSLAEAVPRHMPEVIADWAQFVDEAEEAFSREHRLWRATRDE